MSASLWKADCTIHGLLLYIWGKKGKVIARFSLVRSCNEWKKSYTGWFKNGGQGSKRIIQQRCFLEHKNSVDKWKCTEMSWEIAKLTLKIKNVSSEIQRFTDLCKK